SADASGGDARAGKIVSPTNRGSRKVVRTNRRIGGSVSQTRGSLRTGRRRKDCFQWLWGRRRHHGAWIIFVGRKRNGGVQRTAGSGREVGVCHGLVGEPRPVWSNRESLIRMPQVMPASLRTIAACLHRTPAAGAVAAVVDEEP